jgi:hypothetical protein
VLLRNLEYAAVLWGFILRFALRCLAHNPCRMAERRSDAKTHAHTAHRRALHWQTLELGPPDEAEISSQRSFRPAAIVCRRFSPTLSAISSESMATGPSGNLQAAGASGESSLILERPPSDENNTQAHPAVHFADDPPTVSTKYVYIYIYIYIDRDTVRGVAGEIISRTVQLAVHTVNKIAVRVSRPTTLLIQIEKTLLQATDEVSNTVVTGAPLSRRKT